MAKPRKSLVKPRTSAFINQNGLCYYCNQPMWLKRTDELTVKYTLTPGQARQLQCTGEHLLSHKDGGSVSPNNIVAACRFCNNRRHRRIKPVDPEMHRVRVRSRIGRGRWHGIQVRKNSS